MNKKILFLVLSVLLCAALLITGITVGQKNSQDDDGSDTPKPPVTLAPPQYDTEQSTDAPESSESVPPPPYQDKTFTLLVPDSGELLLGEAMVGNSVNEAVYERNLAVCRETGVMMQFRYSLDVYKDCEAIALSGVDAPDFITLNMKSDGSRFLMNGGLWDLSSLSDSLSNADNELSKSLSVAGKQYFIIGDATPSYVLSLYRLKVKRSSSLTLPLSKSSQNGALTYETLFEILAECGQQIDLDEAGLHALISDGLFTLSVDGTASIDSDGYAQRTSAIAIHSTLVNTDVGISGDVTVGTYSDNSYVYLPLPSHEGNAVGPIVDMSRLYALAATTNCPDKEMTFYVLRMILEHSDGLAERANVEYELDIGVMEDAVFCYYDIFGWGDFSSHAYKAFVGNKTDSLKKTLEAPSRASLQALSILFERNS